MRFDGSCGVVFQFFLLGRMVLAEGKFLGIINFLFDGIGAFIIVSFYALPEKSRF